MAEVRYEPHLTTNTELMLRVHANHYSSHETFASGGPLYVEDYLGTWFGTEARLALTPFVGWRFTAGGEFQYHPKASLTGESIDPDGTTSTYLNDQAPFRFGAGYVLAEGAPLSWLRLNAGARLDVYSTFGPIVVPRAAMILKPYPGGVLKLMFGRAFRAPSVYEQVYNDGGITQAKAVDPSRGLTLGPESIYSGELEYTHRFLESWTVLASIYAGRATGLISAIPDTPGSSVLRYANSPVPALLAGAEAELRREFRRGWMLVASYGYERAQYDDSSLSDPRLVNAPEQQASLRGVVPVVREWLSLAMRLSLEAPRRINLDGSATTGTAVVADLVASGTLRDFGLHDALGLYNLANQHYDVPVSSTFASTTMPQNGRTLLLDLLADFP